MSGPQRQQLADVATVTPTLTDKAVTIQAGKIKSSLYSAIYDLFKTGFDAVYATIASVNGKLSLTGGTMSGAIAMGTSKITGLGNPTLAQDAATKTYVDTAVSPKQNEYDLSNTATGTTNVSIDATSGIGIFTQPVIRKTSAFFDINNTFVEAGETKVEYGLEYEGRGFPLIMHYEILPNRLRFHVANIAVDGGSGTDTDSNLQITFRIIK
jgi:hypothetical protein